MSTTDNIDGLQDAAYRGKMGTGRINVKRALFGLSATIESPVAGQYIGGSTPITGTASCWGFAGYSLEAISAGGTIEAIINSTATVESGLLGTWDTTGLNGSYTIRLNLFAQDGTTDEASVAVIVDNGTPEAEIATPAPGATVDGRVEISGKAQDLYLARYTLKYGAGTAPIAYQNIGTYYTSIASGVLGTWETAGLSGTYTLRLSAFDQVGKSTVTSETVTVGGSVAPTKEVRPLSGLPQTFILPNPFNRSTTTETTFYYNLEGNFGATIYLFDLNGNLIWQKSFSAGENGGKAGVNNPAWNGRDLYNDAVPNGVYLYQITADRRILARGKLIVI